MNTALAVFVQHFTYPIKIPEKSPEKPQTESCIFGCHNSIASTPLMIKP
ncbi:hypothetical protein SAMN04488121_103785 [Chitinophaga filiformis]|uniref:Uncharacterized protein n=1 Tax=Chitinophaga filiformis TaxID=104663 RepID=A0A1G7S9E0_CHIFI|nr:hypothetical protein SAMN04488121_103785 [Chitinophaga filiformis]